MGDALTLDCGDGDPLRKYNKMLSCTLKMGEFCGGKLYPNKAIKRGGILIAIY